MHYCQDEIITLKDLNLLKLNLLKNKKSPEIKELIERINNNFIEFYKLNNKDRPKEIHILEKIKISLEKKEYLNINNNLYKNDKMANNDYFFAYYDNHFTTEPNNINNNVNG